MPFLPLLDSQGRLFGKINLIDAFTVLVGTLVVAGWFSVQAGWHRTSAEQVKGETDIVYSIYLRSVNVLDTHLFQPKDSIMVTIRNQPRGKVTVEDVKVFSREVALANASGRVQSVPDPAEKNTYDFLIRVRDHAIVSTDGYVTNGVKVKIGMKIDIETFNTQLHGVVASLKAVQ